MKFKEALKMKKAKELLDNLRKAPIKDLIEMREIIDTIIKEREEKQ